MKLRLKELREGQFLTQRKLAQRAGLTHATIVRLEQGSQTPTFQTIRKLAAALEIEPRELVIPEGE